MQTLETESYEYSLKDDDPPSAPRAPLFDLCPARVRSNALLDVAVKYA